MHFRNIQHYINNIIIGNMQKVYTMWTIYFQIYSIVN